MLLGLAERGQRLVVAAGLRERAARERVHEREVPPVADRVQRGRGLGEVLAHRRRVADLLVAAGQLEMREAHRAGVVRRLGVTHGPLVQRDRARLLAAGLGHPPVQAPEVREERLGNRLTQGSRADGRAPRSPG